MSFFYKVFYGFCWLLALLPLRCLYLLSDLFFLLVYYVIRYRRKVVLRNLRNSFPEKTEKERLQIARKFYQFVCDLFIETIKMTNTSAVEMRRHIYYKNPEILDELYKKKKHIFIATGHYGNWEWLAALKQPPQYYPVTLYKPLTNKLFDKFFYNMRSKYGTYVVSMNDTLRVITRLLREGKIIMMGFLSDQSPRGKEVQYWMSFLNQETPVFLGIEKLAKRYNTAVLYYEIRRVRRGYYEVDITVITENAAETGDKEITNQHVKLLEETIRRNPQYWLWSHKRWKHKSESSL